MTTHFAFWGGTFKSNPQMFEGAYLSKILKCLRGHIWGFLLRSVSSLSCVFCANFSDILKCAPSDSCVPPPPHPQPAGISGTFVVTFWPKVRERFQKEKRKNWVHHSMGPPTYRRLEDKSYTILQMTYCTLYIATSCQKYEKIAKSWQKLPLFAISCQDQDIPKKRPRYPKDIPKIS